MRWLSLWKMANVNEKLAAETRVAVEVNIAEEFEIESPEPIRFLLH